MKNFKLVFEYDGGKYSGWQRQANSRTIQQEIESAFQKALGYSVTVVGAGRTDAGVHAKGQAANVHLRSDEIAAETIRSFLRGILPRDIVCRAVEPVADEFHARFDALSRTYSYAITRERIAIGRQYAWHVAAALETDEMRRAADSILGKRDFTSFSKSHSSVKNRVCTVTESRWETRGTLLVYTITADRFVYSMVRALVGAMVNVGRGKISSATFFEILTRRERSANMNPLAPPHGLCLERVNY